MRFKITLQVLFQGNLCRQHSVQHTRARMNCSPRRHKVCPAFNSLLARSSVSTVSIGFELVRKSFWKKTDGGPLTSTLTVIVTPSSPSTELRRPRYQRRVTHRAHRGIRQRTTAQRRRDLPQNPPIPTGAQCSFSEAMAGEAIIEQDQASPTTPQKYRDPMCV